MEYIFMTYLAIIVAFVGFVVYRFFFFVMKEDFSTDRYTYTIKDGIETVIDKNDR